MAEALRLWSLVLFLLSLLSGVVALLRTRLLFVYFISSFVCFFYLFLRCFSGLCLLSLSGGSGRTTCFFFVRSRFVIIFGLCFWFCVFCLLLLCLKFSGCGFFLYSVCSFCLVAVLLKIRSMLVLFFLFCIQAMVLFFCLCLVFFVWLVEVWLNLSGCGLVSSVLSGAFGLK